MLQQDLGIFGPVTDKEDIQKHKQEIKAIGEGLPFKNIVLPEFSNPCYEPEKIRQKRTFVSNSGDNQQAVGRFLVERGTVDILSNEQCFELFKEIHWSVFQIRKLAIEEYRNAEESRQALVQARRLVSRVDGAEEELFIANRRLVVNCVKSYFWMGQVWISDFLQEGSKALSNAVRKFDFTRGTPFFAYAQKAVQNRLRNFFRDHVRSGSIGITPSREMLMIKEIIDNWKTDNDGEVPDEEVIAKITGFESSRVKKLLGFLRQYEKVPSPPVSLDAMLGDSEANLYDLVEDGDAEVAAEEAEKSEIWAAIDKLPPRARYIMRLRFIEGRTLEETGQALNLTRARIKQIQDETLKKLRYMLKQHTED